MLSLGEDMPSDPGHLGRLPASAGMEPNFDIDEFKAFMVGRKTRPFLCGAFGQH